MTNAEKFKEVFGFELNTKAFEHNFCIVKHITETCIEHNDCYTCPYGINWDEKEYIEREEQTNEQNTNL